MFISSNAHQPESAFLFCNCAEFQMVNKPKSTYVPPKSKNLKTSKVKSTKLVAKSEKPSVPLQKKSSTKPESPPVVTKVQTQLTNVSEGKFCAHS